MTNRTLDCVEREFCDRHIDITFIIQQGLIVVHTRLETTPQFAVVVSTNANFEWTIGRSNHCSIVMQNSTVSRQHAVLGYDKHSGFYVMDCISHNGTFLNQIRLIPLKRYLLRDRDTLALIGQNIQINIFTKA